MNQDANDAFTDAVAALYKDDPDLAVMLLACAYVSLMEQRLREVGKHEVKVVVRNPNDFDPAEILGYAYQRSARVCFDHGFIEDMLTAKMDRAARVIKDVEERSREDIKTVPLEFRPRRYGRAST